MKIMRVLLPAAVLVALLHLSADGQEKKKEEVKTPPTPIPSKLTPALPPSGTACCPPGYSFRHLDGKPIVFVVHGVGGDTKLGDNLLDLNSERHLGLRLKVVPWARHNALYQDLLDQKAHLHAAASIACTITAIRKDCPNLPIFLIGHSAGARIVLAAGEMVPENSVDRIIVLAPAVTCSYDLTGAMRGSRGGVVNFYSSEDGILEAAEQHTRLADGLIGPAAGRVGFRPPCSDPREVAIYFSRLQQIRWTEAWAGNGGHGVWTISHNLRRMVPIMFTCTTTVIAPPPPPPIMPPVLDKKMPLAK